MLTAASISGTFAQLDLPSGYRVVYGPTEVAITNGCPADFNADGATDLFDYLDFLNAFSTGGKGSDFNHDGVTDFFDYLDFVSAFSTGC